MPTLREAEPSSADRIADERDHLAHLLLIGWTLVQEQESGPALTLSSPELDHPTDSLD